MRSVVTRRLPTYPEAPKKEVPSTPAAYVPPAELKEWNEENPWFGTDKRKTALALGIAQELREGGEKSTGRVFFDKVKEEMEATLGTKVRAAETSKVEGGRNGSDLESPRSGGKKSFSSLPADAKAACDADARQFVGPAKKHKTIDEWRARYAQIYYEGS